MASFSISCADCGSEYETNRKNTRYCRVCRVLRNLIYYGPKLTTCWSCEEKFAPWEDKQVFCGGCARKADSAPTGTCGLCKEETKVIHQDIHVCHTCATDPKSRPKLVRALTAKAERRAAA